MQQPRNVSLYVRVDEPLHQQLAAEAERSFRTLSAEVAFRLRKSIDETARDKAGE
jgi:hypothetical protein